MLVIFWRQVRSPFTWIRYFLSFVLALGFYGGANAQNAPKPQRKLRIIVASGAACRVRPDRSAVAVTAYEVGDVVSVSNESSAGGETWYETSRERRNSYGPVVGPAAHCWIYGPLTAETDASVLSAPGALPEATAEAVLRRKNAQFEDYVAAENLILSSKSERIQPEMAGLLEFRRLSLVQAAVRPRISGSEAYKNPLNESWLVSHRDLVLYLDPADQWFMRPEPFWALYDEYPHESWSDELAWTAAQIQIPEDE